MNKKEILTINKARWDQSAERFFGRTALPEYGPFAPTERELGLFGDVDSKTVLDIGCGSGHSLKYMGDHGARELWGLDLSKTQIDTAYKVLEGQDADVKLFESPMEERPGIPKGYFDLVYSIYALGWTVDLPQTLANIYDYLKPGGMFIFSWEHPLHDRLVYVESDLLLMKSYNKVGPEFNEAWHNEVVIHHRKLSTYVNALVQAGFTIEKLIDDVILPDQTQDDPMQWYSVQKAQWIPATFIVKASKR